MQNTVEIELSSRQRTILRGVVEEFVATREAVGSRTLLQRLGLDVSSSTVRGELAELERMGLLTHPHTSAGRIPTEEGYRAYVADLIEHGGTRPDSLPLPLGDARAELEGALQET